MRRAGKTTLPYAFCLFCAVAGLVLLMAAVGAGLAWRDARATEPDRADAVLQAALDPATETLNAYFEPVVAELYRTRRWALSGVLPEKAMGQWPATLLPLLSDQDRIRSIRMVKDDGDAWHWLRDGTTWRGYNALRGVTVASRWSAAGALLPGKPSPSPQDDPRESEWFEAVIARSDDGAAVQLYCAAPDATEGSTAIALALPLQFSSGRRGVLAVEVDQAALQTQLNGLAPDGVQLAFDFGGRLVRHLQDDATLALLQERAVPASVNPALNALLPTTAGASGQAWYKAAVYQLGGDGVWWVLAAVERGALPAPALPPGRYLVWSLAAGMTGALVLSMLLGRKITRPLRQVADRARNIQALDEHYVPWPTSHFTEVNALTSALEDIYESAVEHLDYHDAPLVVWAQPDEDPADDTIVVDAVRHVMNIPRGRSDRESVSTEEPAIPVSGIPEGAAARANTPLAAQLQMLHGTRREVRRLQGQLAGANEELRTTGARFEEAQLRMRRQRSCLRELHKRLQAEETVSGGLLEQLREALDVSGVSLWIAGEQPTRFRQRLTTGGAQVHAAPLQAGLRLRALLEEESAVAVVDPRNDTRLEDVLAHAAFQNTTPALLLAPVKLAGQLLGFMLAAHTGQPRRWKSDEELFLTSVAAQCAGTLWRQRRQQARAIAEAHVAQARPNAAPQNGNGNGNGNVNGHRNGKSNGNGVAHASQVLVEDGELVVLVWETDLAGCIKRIQGDVAAIYGRTPEQLIGQPITFLSDEAQGRTDLDRLSLLFAGVPCSGYQTCHRGASGARVHLRIDAELLRDANDRIAGARGTARLLQVAAAV